MIDHQRCEDCHILAHTALTKEKAGVLPTVTNLFYVAYVSNAIALVGRMGSKLLILVNN